MFLGNKTVNGTSMSAGANSKAA